MGQIEMGNIPHLCSIRINRDDGTLYYIKFIQYRGKRGQLCIDLDICIHSIGNHGIFILYNSKVWYL